MIQHILFRGYSTPIFSSPGQSPGTAIALPPASASASASTYVKDFQELIFSRPFDIFGSYLVWWYSSKVLFSNTPAHHLKVKVVDDGGSFRCASNWRPGGRRLDPRRGLATFFCGDWSWNIFSCQEGQMSVTGERMCTILVNRLEDYACPVSVRLSKLTALDTSPLGWLDRKTSPQRNKQGQGHGLRNF